MSYKQNQTLPNAKTLSKDSQFTMLNPLWLCISYSDLSSSERLLLLTLHSFVDDNGICFPSYPTILKFSGLSMNTVLKCVKSLVAKGWIAYRQGNGSTHKSNTYALNVDRFMNFVPPEMRIKKEEEAFVPTFTVDPNLDVIQKDKPKKVAQKKPVTIKSEAVVIKPQSVKPLNDSMVVVDECFTGPDESYLEYTDQCSNLGDTYKALPIRQFCDSDYRYSTIETKKHKCLITNGCWMVSKAAFLEVKSLGQESFKSLCCIDVDYQRELDKKEYFKGKKKKGNGKA